MQAEIKESVQNSKNYKNVSEEVIDKTIEKETPKYKKKKDIEQSVRAKLHAWVTMFYENYEKLIKNMSNKDMDESFYNELLKTHVSTKERFSFIDEFYSDIESVVGNVDSILDLGAGFNPIAYFMYTKNKDVHYTSIDVESRGVEILNSCLKRFTNNANAVVGDVVNFKSEDCYDMVFLFKILPLLEQQKRGSTIELIKYLNTKYLCISYPTKTLSGKNVGMYSKYKQDIEKIITECNIQQIFEKEYKNEILFILKK